MDALVETPSRLEPMRLGKKYGVHPKLFYHLEELRRRDQKVCSEVEGHLISYKAHPLLMPYYTV